MINVVFYSAEHVTDCSQKASVWEYLGRQALVSWNLDPVISVYGVPSLTHATSWHKAFLSKNVWVDFTIIVLPGLNKSSPAQDEVTKYPE
ncbi:hypothetical protein BaRGS_00015590, partial [Batillaria attramentaria]